MKKQLASEITVFAFSGQHLHLRRPEGVGRVTTIVTDAIGENRLSESYQAMRQVRFPIDRISPGRTR